MLIKAGVIYKHQSDDAFLPANKYMVKQNIDSYYLWAIKPELPSTTYHIIILKFLQDELLDWFHQNLAHSGYKRMYLTIK